jgi:uncharacterized coiled-coil protein SlyX
MNKTQKIVLGAGIFVATLMSLFPPYLIKCGQSGMSGQKFYGYASLLSPPKPSFYKYSVADNLPSRIRTAKREAQLELNIQSLKNQQAQQIAEEWLQMERRSGILGGILDRLKQSESEYIANQVETTKKNQAEAHSKLDHSTNLVIDFPRLIIQWILVVFVTGGIFVLLPVLFTSKLVACIRTQVLGYSIQDKTMLQYTCPNCKAIQEVSESPNPQLVKCLQCKIEFIAPPIGAFCQQK